MKKRTYTPGQILHKYISAEELESIRTDKELRNKAAEKFAKSVKRKLA